MRRQNTIGIILAGGSGSRLWPLSRQMYPKQLLKLTGDKTLFQSTADRLLGVADEIFTITNIQQASDIAMQLGEIELKGNILTEPLGRNTAPAIAMGAFYAAKNVASDAILIIAPSDHYIKENKAFSATLKNAIELAKDNHIVTFGIVPSKPDTGYGYIKTQKGHSEFLKCHSGLDPESENKQILKQVQDDISIVQDDKNNALKVDEFKEKPDLKTAKEYIQSKNYFWNSGIFVAKASVLIEELEKFSPEITKLMNKAEFSDSMPTVDFSVYENLPDISIDYAVMEKSDKIVLLPLDCGWNDLGSWESIYEISPKDDNGNFISGNVIDLDSKNSMVYSTSKLVSTIGLEDVILVETEDAILACNANKSQDVKKIFEKLKKDNDERHLVHQTVYRPWGFYTVLQRGEGFLTKTIQVSPKASLSLQLHHHRSEHWVVLSGKARVTIEDKVHELCAGESIDIAIEEKHSLENPDSSVPLKILEVQKGDYLSEDDIVRFKDRYGRIRV